MMSDSLFAEAGWLFFALWSIAVATVTITAFGRVFSIANSSLEFVLGLLAWLAVPALGASPLDLSASGLRSGTSTSVSAACEKTSQRLHLLLVHSVVWLG